MTELEIIEKQERVNAAKDSFNNVLNAYNDILKNGTPDRVAVGYSWGSTAFFLKKESADAILFVLQQAVQKDLEDRKIVIDSLEEELKQITNG